MRILSQDGIGTIDLPYEQIGIGINTHNNKEIIAYPLISLHEDDYWTMARYSTESKAKRAMEILRKAYAPTYLINGAVIEPDEIFTNSFIISPTKKSSDIEVETLENFHFQFPADDELEG